MGSQQMAGSYNTFPRSARTSPTTSGASTPTQRASTSALFSPARQATSPVVIPNRQTIHARLERRNSAGGTPSAASERDGGRFRDEVERAQNEANPTSWYGIMQRVGSVGSASADEEGGGAPISPRVGGRQVTRKGSRGSLLGSGFSSISRRNRDGSPIPIPPTLTEEPASYAELDSPPLSPRRISVCSPSPNRQKHSHRPKDDTDSDSDSDDEDEPLKRTKLSFPTLTPVTKGVIKCVLAYLLAEAFTFVPVLTDFLGAPWDLDGPVRNAHVVATIAVYFYPARTLGAQVEANLFLVLGLFYAMFICCGSMGMSVILDRYDLQVLGHALVVVFWLGGGYALLAWFKATINKPTATTACSLVSLICSVIITKEGAYHVGRFEEYAILQILLIVAIGSSISNIVCCVVWPSSATSKLQLDLNMTLSSFSTLIELLTKSFLLDDDIRTRPTALKRAIDAHQSSYTTLRASLGQAKFEIFDPRLQETMSYERLIDTMLRLSQGLTGLRAGCALQNELMDAEREGKLDDRAPNDSEKDRLMEQLMVLAKFKERVGGSLEALTSTSRRALSYLRTSFIHTKAGHKTLHALARGDQEAGAGPGADLAQIKSELEASLLLFKREHARAIKLLYRSHSPDDTLFNAQDLEEDLKDPFADQPAERERNYDLFRLYHFCQNLEQWVEELNLLIGEFEIIRQNEEEIAKAALARKRRFGPLAFVATIFAGVRFKQRRGRRRRAKTALDERASSLWEQFIGVFSSRSVNPFPHIEDGAVTSHRTSTPLPGWARFKRTLWIIGHRLRQPTTRFAIKTGLGAALLATPAFTELRPWFLKMRGEWALISYMVVMAPSLGQTNFLAAGRILGTLTGAAAAVAFYSTFPDNPVALPLLGALVSVPCFYVIITRPQYGPASRFVLLTLNLTQLYAFNLREQDVDVKTIAFQRAFAVAIGVVWSLFVSVYVWPAQARRELRIGLSEYLQNCSHLYLSIVSQYSTPPRSLANLSHSTETSQLLIKHLDMAEKECIEMEIWLQESLIKIQGLLAATAHEPRLKGGSFPIAEYSLVLQSCQSVLDLLTSIQHVTTRESWYTSVRRDFVVHVGREQREMVGNILLAFSLLASSLTLKSPLPPYLPPASAARRQLLRKLETLPVVRKRIVRSTESLLFLAYTVQMADVISELGFLGSAFQGLFGIAGGGSTEEFEALFVSHDDSNVSSDEEDGAD